MKLSFTSKDGKPVTVEADDADMILAEIETGDQDFVMLRFRPGTMKPTVDPATAVHVRLDGAAQ